MRTSHRIGAPAFRAASPACGEVVRGLHVARQVGHAAGVDHPHHDPLGGALEAREVGLGPDHREGAGVDRPTVAQVVEAGTHDGRGPGGCSGKIWAREWAESALLTRSSAASKGRRIAGNASGRPDSTTSYCPSRPTRVRSAAPGWAQPLRQPETWARRPCAAKGRKASASRAASSKVGVEPDAQAGAPGAGRHRAARIVGPRQESGPGQGFARDFGGCGIGARRGGSRGSARGAGRLHRRRPPSRRDCRGRRPCSARRGRRPGGRRGHPPSAVRIAGPPAPGRRGVGCGVRSRRQPTPPVSLPRRGNPRTGPMGVGRASTPGLRTDAAAGAGMRDRAKRAGISARATSGTSRIRRCPLAASRCRAAATTVSASSSGRRHQAASPARCRARPPVG